MIQSLGWGVGVQKAVFSLCFFRDKRDLPIALGQNYGEQELDFYNIQEGVYPRHWVGIQGRYRIKPPEVNTELNGARFRDRYWGTPPRACGFFYDD